MLIPGKMRSGKKHHYLILALLVIVLAGTYACKNDPDRDPAESTASTDTRGVAGLVSSMNMYHFKEPVEAPEFELGSVDGSSVRLSQYRGKVVLLSFWATW